MLRLESGKSIPETEPGAQEGVAPPARVGSVSDASASLLSSVRNPLANVFWIRHSTSSRVDFVNLGF